MNKTNSAVQSARIEELDLGEIQQVAGGSIFRVAIDPGAGPGQFLRLPLPPNIPVVPIFPRTP